jgi:hypothetical protein
MYFHLSSFKMPCLIHLSRPMRRWRSAKCLIVCIRAMQHGRIQGVQGCASPFRLKVPFLYRKCPFCRRVQFSMFVPMLLETPKTPLGLSTKRALSVKKGTFGQKGPIWHCLTSIQSSLVGSGWSNKARIHCTKPKFSPEKNPCFFCN